METSRFVLDNGLTVLIREHHAAPVAAMAIWVGVGSADERAHEAGLAHVHEHMIFKGTARRGVGEIAREIEASGGSINAFTSFDQTVYHVTISSRYFEAGLDILCDAVSAPAFDPDELARELEVILEEIKRGEDQPGRQTMERMFELAYAEHPYALPVIGTRASVAAFTRPDVLAFFERWYVPANMTLIIVGDVDAAEARAMSEARLGLLPRRPVPARERTAEPPQAATRVGLIAGDTREVHAAMAFHVGGVDHEDGPALDVLRLLLCYGDSSRLVERLERDLQWVNDISAGAYMPRDPGLFLLNTSHIDDPEHPGVAAVIEATLAVVDALGRRPVSAEDLLRAKTLLQSSQVYQRQTMEGQAMALGSYEVVAGGLEHEALYFSRLLSVTPADLQALVQRVFTPENLTLVVYAEQAFIDRVDEAALRDAAHRALTGASPLGGDDTGEGLERDAFGIVRYAVEGGPVVLIQEDASVELVSVRLAFLGGQRREDPALSGLSHLLSGVWARGTRSRSLTEISDEVEGMGSGLDAYGGRNSMGLQMDMLSCHFSRAMGLIADCLAHPTFDPELIDLERRLTLESLQARTDSLGLCVSSLLRAELFEGHPYALDIIGTDESLPQIGRQEIIDFYRRHVQPDRMVISVVGDVVAEEVVAQIEERFGPGVRFLDGPESAPEDPAPAMPPLKGPRFVTTALPKNQAALSLGFRAVDLHSHHRHRLDLIIAILSGQGGRLFMELRDQQSLAYSVYASVLLGVDPGSVSLHITTSPEKIEQAARGLFEQVFRLQETLVSEDELDRARLYLIGNHDIQLQAFGARAMQMALDELYGLGHQSHRNIPQELMNVTTEELRETCRELLTLDRAVLAIVHPPDAALPDLADLGMPAPVVVPL